MSANCPVTVVCYCVTILHKRFLALFYCELEKFKQYNNMVCTLMKKHRHHSHRRRNGGGDGGACSRNVETTGAGVSFRPHNIFPDFCMLFLKLPVVIYLVFYCEMQRTSLLIMTTVDILLHCLIRATEWH